MRTIGLVVIIILMGSSISIVRAADYYAARNGQPPGGNCTTWELAASNIQDAVNAATTNDTVWVGAGRYTVPPNATNYIGTNVVYINKPLTLRSSNGVPATTIIDGGGVNRGITVNSSAGSTKSFVLDGFTVSNCWATNFGGGILFTNTLLYTVRNCVISDNRVALGSDGSSGGGIYSSSAGTTFVLTNCVIRGNQATNFGGGVFVYGGSGPLNINNCLIQSNSVRSGYGGGVYADREPVAVAFNVENSEISYNSCSHNGGGFYFASWSAVVRRFFKNCLMYKNSAGDTGGVIDLWGQSVVLDSCTIVDNTAAANAGGVSVRTTGTGLLQMRNTIIYSNSPANYKVPTAGIAYLTNSCSYPSNANTLAGPGNITNPPAFVDFAGQNYRLSRASPCINSGLNQAWMEGAKDFDGSPRVDRFSGRVDMGCYEHLSRGMLFKAR